MKYKIEEMFYIKKYQSQEIDWYRWENRNLIPFKNRRGVYLLAYKDNNKLKIDNVQNLICEEIIYIGEAHGEKRNLLVRWKEFEKAAKDGISNHSGGREFHKQGLKFKGLYIAAFPISKDIPLLEQQLLAMLIERELLWEYGKQFHCRPKCNKE